MTRWLGDRFGVVIVWLMAAAMPLALAGCGGAGTEKTAQASSRVPRAVPVTVAPLAHRTVERTVDVVGTLKGWEHVTVGAKLIAMRVARVAKVYHDIGDRVRPGKLLVELEATEADLAVQQSERQLQVELAKLGLKEMPKANFDVAKVPAVVQADVALERARNNLGRERALNRRGAGTVQDLQNAENDLRGAEARLAHEILVARSTLANAQAARVALNVSKLGRSDMEIRTPVPFINPPGVTTPVTYALTKRSVAEGQMLKQGDPIANLVIQNPLRLWLNVPEQYSSNVQVGQPVRLSVTGHPGTVFEGKVARINPAVDDVSRTFQVEALVPNNLGMLRPGGFAKASIVIDSESNAVVVPLESIVQFAGVTKLFIVENDKARAINVETRLEGPDWIEVIGKLPSQAEVVTSGQTQLADGTLVVVRTEKKLDKRE